MFKIFIQNKKHTPDKNLIMTRLYLMLILLLTFQQAFSQDGKFDLQFELNNVDCNNMKVYVDLSVKANNSAAVFDVAEQNYRMSFPRSVDNPFIESELTLSGFVVGAGGGGSFFNNHTLTGSIDTVVSYNIELAGGDGYTLSETTWTPVGRIGFDIMSSTECFELKWHTYDEVDFPNTVVIEKFDDELYIAEEGLYTNLGSVCLFDMCAMAPLAYDDYYDTDEQTPFSIDLLGNDVDPNGNLNPGSFNLLSSPPGTEVSLAPTSDPGYFTCTPAAGFTGAVTPFDYEICDTDNQCVTATVFITVYPYTGISTPEDDYAINLYPTVADNEIAVEYLDINMQGSTGIMITDVNGRTLETYNKNISGSPVHRFNVEKLPQGVYFLSTMIEGKWVSRKFIKL